MTERRWTDADVAHAYQAGVQHERERIAAAYAELDESWLLRGPQIHFDRVDARRELFRRCAELHAERAGRTYREYPGGPVDWETGQPVAVTR